jgi:hypothetical protein
MNELIFHTNELKSLAVARHFQLQGRNFTIFDSQKKLNFDASFIIQGHSFDCGYHAIDNGRSKEWGCILDSLDLSWSTTSGARAVVLMGQMLPRNYDKVDLSGVISDVDTRKFQEPFLRHLESHYGTELVEYCLKDIVTSYAQNSIWAEAKLSPKEILKNVYPWFFPKSDTDSYNLIQPHFHFFNSGKRSSRYPTDGGFADITDALREAVKAHIVGIESDNNYRFGVFDDAGVFVSPGSNRKGLHIVPVNHFALSQQFLLPYPQSRQTNFYLVSIILVEPIILNVNEILVGDTHYLFDRISSPDVLQHKTVMRVQVEAERVVELDANELVENIKLFFDRFLGKVEFKYIDIKKLKINRFLDHELEPKTHHITRFVEERNPGLLVLNRTLNFENLSDGIPKFIELINGIKHENFQTR